MHPSAVTQRRLSRASTLTHYRACNQPAIRFRLLGRLEITRLLCLSPRKFRLLLRSVLGNLQHVDRLAAVISRPLPCSKSFLDQSGPPIGPEYGHVSHRATAPSNAARPHSLVSSTATSISKYTEHLICCPRWLDDIFHARAPSYSIVRLDVCT
jgi:hypothetical protein